MKKWWIIALLLISQSALATEDFTVSYDMGQGVELILYPDRPCEKWNTASEGVDLKFAEAVNNNTGDKVTGCFTTDGNIVYINLTDEVTKHFYHYELKAEKFKKMISV